MLLCISCNCYAQITQQQYGFKQISVGNGLSNRIVNGFCQDDNHFIWIATDDGLNKLNGNKVIQFYKTNKSVYSNKIQKLIKLKNNKIFVSTNSGCSILNCNTETFEAIVDTTNKLQFEYIPSCFEANNFLWIYGSTGVFKIKNSRVVSYNPYRFTKEQLITKGGTVNRFFDVIYCNQRLFTNMGRLLIELDTATMQPINNYIIGLKNHEGVTQMQYVNNCLWLSTWGNGLIQFNLTSKKQTYHPILNDIAFSVTAQNDTLYVSNQTGYTVFNTNTFEQKDVLINNEVHNIFFDAKRTFWLSTSNGVFYKEKLDALINTYSIQNILGNRISDNKGLPISVSYTKNNLFIGLQYANGLCVLNKDFNKEKYIPSIAPNTSNTGYKDIKYVLQDGDTYWITCNSGLVLCDKSFKLIAKYLPINDDYVLGTPTAFNQIVQLSKDELLIGSFTGVLVFNTNTRTFAKVFAAKKDGSFKVLQSFTTHIELKDKHTVFIATEKGVFELNLTLNSIKAISVSVNNLRFNDVLYYKQNLYLATDGSFLKHDLITNKTTEFAREQGLSSSVIYALQLDTLHNGIWLATANGINFFNFNSQQFDVVNTADGLVDNNIEGCFSLIENKLYVGNINAISVIKTNFITQKNINKKIYINNVKVNDINCFNKLFIEVPNENAIVEINVGMPLMYLRNDGFLYYKINNKWSQQLTDNTINFQNLSNGTYDIYFANKPIDSFISSHITLKVIPPFYKKIWFIALIAIALIALFYFIITARVKKIKLAIETKNNINNQLTTLKETAFRSQMNPHFLFNTLNAINSFIIENKTEKASDYLVMFSKLMRKILENSKHKTISLEQEFESLKLYIELENARLENSFDYTFTIDKTIDTFGIEVPPLIIQPYVENAIWHGLRNKMIAGNIWVNAVMKTSNTLLIQVVDDGIGMDAARKLKQQQTTHKSFGLDITQARIKLMNNSNSISISDRLIDNEIAGTIVEIILIF